MIRELLAYEGTLLPGLSKLFGGKPKLPAAPPPLPTVADESVVRKKEEERLAAVQRRGLLSTRKTKGGTGDTSKPTTQRGKLLGDGSGSGEMVS